MNRGKILPDELQHQQLVKIRIQQRPHNRVQLKVVVVRTLCKVHIHVGILTLRLLPPIGSLAIVGLYIAEESDDFERSIIVQSMLWGLGGALSVSTIWGSLEDFANAPHISTFYVFLFFWIFMGISQPFIRRRYR